HPILTSHLTVILIINILPPRHTKPTLFPYTTLFRSHTRTMAELSRLPGVLAAALVNYLPLAEELTRGDFQVEGGLRPKGFIVDKPCVSSGYFRTMEIHLLRGREFTERDTATAPAVVVVSQSVAQTLWPGEDPIGKRISMEDDPGPGDWLTVIGVADDVKQKGLAEKSDPAIY